MDLKNQVGDNFITLYYGTKDLELVDINPRHNKNDESNFKVFEFGGGFYLTPHLNVAVGYSMIDSCKTFSESISKDDITSLINVEHKFESNIHSFKLDLRELSNYEYKECFNTDEYFKTIISTIEGYIENIDYYPPQYITGGLLCGEYWDNTFKNITLAEIHQLSENILEFSQSCIQNLKKIYDDNDKETIAEQYCLHENLDILTDYRKIVTINNLQSLEEIKKIFEEGECDYERTRIL